MKWPAPFGCDHWPQKDDIIDWYDGPLSWIARDQAGVPFLVLWASGEPADPADAYTRERRVYLVSQVTEADVEHLRRGTLAFQTAVQRAPSHFLVTEEWVGEEAGLRGVALADVPLDWLPRDEEAE